MLIAIIIMQWIITGVIVVSWINDVSIRVGYHSGMDLKCFLLTVLLGIFWPVALIFCYGDMIDYKKEHKE